MPRNRPSAGQHLRNVFANWGAFFLSAVAGLFISPFIVRSLGTESFGLWTIIGSLTGSLGIFDLGLRSATVRFISRDHARGDHMAASHKAGQIRSLFGIAAVLALITGGILVLRLEHAFNLPAELVRPGQIAMALTVVSFALSLENSVTGGIMMAMERLDLLGTADIAYGLIRIVLILVVLGKGGGLLGLASIGFVLTVTRYAVNQWLARRTYPELDLRHRMPRWKDTRSIFDVSIFSTVIYTSSTLAAQAGALIVGAMLPLSSAAQYGVGTTLPGYANSLNRPIAQSVHPRASRLDAEDDISGLRSVILNTGRLSALVLLPMVLAFLIRGSTFIEIWQGSEFRGPAGALLGILSIDIVFAGPRHVIQATFIGSGRHRVLGVWYVASALVRIAATAGLVYLMGLQGAGWAVVIPGILMALLVMPALCRKYYGMNRLNMIWQIWLRPILAMLPFAVALWAMEEWVPTRGYASFFSQIALTMPIALVSGALFGLTRKERELGLGMIKSRIAALRGNHVGIA